MRKILFLIILFSTLTSFGNEESWFCTDDQAMRQGNMVSMCGVGTSSTEGDARTAAFKNAINEFVIMCQFSSDCKGHKINVEPKRSTCGHKMAGDIFHSFTCYRLFQFTIIN